MLFLRIIFDYSSQNFSWAFPIKILYLCTHCISFMAAKGRRECIMTLSAQYLRSQKELSELYSILKFGFHWADINEMPLFENKEQTSRQVSGNP